VILVKRRYYFRKYPAVLFLLLLINVIAYAEAGFSGQRAAGGSGIQNRLARSNGDIIAAGEHRGYEYYRDLERSKKTPFKSSASSANKNKTSASPETFNYTVKKGDTLFRIAQNNGSTVKEISDLNNLSNNNKIYAGMKLKIPRSGIGGPGNSGIEKNQKRSSGKSRAGKENLSFLWPLKKVDKYKRDGEEGVKSIGIVITGPAGSAVIASEAGVVKRTGYMRGFGRYVVVNHGNRYLTVYSNLMTVNVKEGDRIGKGGAIGLISDDRTLHFQIDYAGKPRNPLDYLPGKS
jgi:LysM repeat protein